jgi:parallel beta-helix repeat protein
MIRKWLAVGIIFLFIGTTIIPSSAQNIEKSSSSSKGHWLYVGGNGEGNYTRIQDAINASFDGDTIFVYDDSSPYYEHITVNKTINLIGEDKNTTVIDGNYKLVVVQISASGVVLTGFTIQHSGNFPNEGICVYSNDNQIFENIIKNNGEGLGNGYGIFLDSCSNNVVRNNEIIYNGKGIWILDWDEKGNNNLFSENFIAHNLLNGIDDYDRDSGTIAIWNVIADNGRYNSIHPAVYWGGIQKHDSFSIYHHNTFFFNSNNAYVAGRYGNEWDDGSVGNYWDDWASNPGYPYKYIIPYSSQQESDNHPSAIPFNDRPVVGLPLIDYYALIDEPINFTANTNKDPSTVSWLWNFGDGTTSDEAHPTHRYSSSGLYLMSVTITDNQSRSDTSYSYARIGRAPNTPIITGPTKIKPNEMENYTIVTTDPDGDDIYYYVSYSVGYGGYISYTIGPYKSGEEVVIEAGGWENRGIWTLMVKAIDGAGLESDWGTLDITVPLSYEPPHFRFITWLLDLSPRAFPILRYLLGR